MLFHRCDNSQIPLDTLVVVIWDIRLNHFNKFLPGSEPVAVVRFPLENTPESFHGAIVNAVSHSGHTLRHVRRFQLLVELTIRILEASVTVK